MDKKNTRLLALEILLEVEKKNIYVKEALHKFLFSNQFMEKQDRAFISRLVEGTTEYQVTLDYVIDLYSKTPIRKCKPCIRCLLRMGAYQILYLDRVPDEAACNECVTLAKKKGFSNLAGFVNGVLRTISRQKEQLVYPDVAKNPQKALSVRYSMPQWIVEKMLEWYGLEKAEVMLKSSLNIPDLTIRVNTEKISLCQLTKQLEESGITVASGHYVEEALHLSNINYVNRIAGYKQGQWLVQDESSMLLYSIADIETYRSNSSEIHGNTELHILDLCAAPGGKCTQFAQHLGQAGIVEARDISAKKVEKIEENKERLGLDNLFTRVWDALVPDTEKMEWADVVIADLPCSGLGILSKKNDIKYHIQESQLQELVKLQRGILTNAVQYLKPGGILLYSTCTINPQENRENVEWLLDNFPLEPQEFGGLIPETLHSSLLKPAMLQLLPGVVQCDGFFISKLRKKEEKDV